MDKAVNWANRLTLVRFFLIPVFIILVIYYRPGLEGLRIAALVIFLTAILTDAIDGYVARVKKQRTKLGTFLDPAADKALLISAFICLYLSSRFLIRLPIWVPVLIISWDFILILGLVIIYMATGSVQIAPSSVGKAATFFKMMTVVAILLNFRYSYLIWDAAVFLTVISGIYYIVREGRRLNEKTA